ncbi:MAG: GNAT family N-acetyltransferase [Alphaproteobacteria bacterium]|nr:GNAT family N-acetyltransferase [Alphaproteobacteria bacterium]
MRRDMTDSLIIELSGQLQTPRLLMRPLQCSDIDGLSAAAFETSVGLNKLYSGTLSKRDLTREDVGEYIEECQAGWGKRTLLTFGVFDRINDTLIGLGSLHHLDWQVPKGRVGYWVRQGEQGKGYATEIANVLTRLAFGELKLKRLEIRTAVDNQVSSVIPKRLGYKYLTVFEKNKAGNNGEIWDIEIYVRFDMNNLPDLG